MDLKKALRRVAKVLPKGSHGMRSAGTGGRRRAPGSAVKMLDNPQEQRYLSPVKTKGCSGGGVRE